MGDLRETALEALHHLEKFGLEGSRSGKQCDNCLERIAIIREQLVLDLVEKVEAFEL